MTKSQNRVAQKELRLVTAHYSRTHVLPVYDNSRITKNTNFTCIFEVMNWLSHFDVNMLWKIMHKINLIFWKINKTKTNLGIPPSVFNIKPFKFWCQSIFSSKCHRGSTSHSLYIDNDNISSPTGCTTSSYWHLII